MTPPQLRSLAGLLLAAAIVVGVWTSDLRQGNAALAQTVALAQGQLNRLAAVPGPAQPASATAAAAAGTLPAPESADPARLRRAAAGYGSDARNMAAALQRTKAWCVAAGLLDCTVRRGSVAAAPPAAGASAAAAQRELAPYAVTLGATFNAKGAQTLVETFAASGLLYRIERLSVLQNRTEWDIVFLHDAGVRSDAREGAARADAGEPRR